MSRLPSCRGRTRCRVWCLSFCSPFRMVAVKVNSRLSAGRWVRSHRQPPYCRWSKEIGGDSAAVIQGSECDVPLECTSLEGNKSDALFSRFQRLSLSAQKFSSATIPGEWAMTDDTSRLHHLSSLNECRAVI